MKAIIFPGQGSQKAGMATEFESNFQIVKEYLQELMKLLNSIFQKLF